MRLGVSGLRMIGRVRVRLGRVMCRLVLFLFVVTVILVSVGMRLMLMMLLRFLRMFMCW